MTSAATDAEMPLAASAIAAISLQYRTAGVGIGRAHLQLLSALCMQSLLCLALQSLQLLFERIENAALTCQMCV